MSSKEEEEVEDEGVEEEETTISVHLVEKTSVAGVSDVRESDSESKEKVEPDEGITRQLPPLIHRLRV